MKTPLYKLQQQKLWRARNPDYMKNYAKNNRIKTLLKISSELKCKRCGCDEIRCLEVNHKNGGGSIEVKRLKSTGRFHHDILKGKRHTKDLEILCRPCNAIDHLERKIGHVLPMRVIWKRRLDI